MPYGVTGVTAKLQPFTRAIARAVCLCIVSYVRDFEQEQQAAPTEIRWLKER